jgi:hypothetical protein
VKKFEELHQMSPTLKMFSFQAKLFQASIIGNKHSAMLVYKVFAKVEGPLRAPLSWQNELK